MNIRGWLSGSTAYDLYMKASNEIASYARAKRPKRWLSQAGFLVACGVISALATVLIERSGLFGRDATWFLVFLVATIGIATHIKTGRKLRRHDYLVTMIAAQVEALQLNTEGKMPFDEAFREYIRLNRPLLAGATADNIDHYLAMSASETDRKRVTG
jgi:hypothetical protein